MQQQLNESQQAEAISELTNMLKPHILRRTKQTVDLRLPELQEIQVKVALVEAQKYLYKNLILKNYEVLKTKNNPKTSL